MRKLDPGQTTEEQVQSTFPKRKGRLRRASAVFGLMRPGMAVWAGTTRIRSGWSFIRTLITILRNGAGQEGQIRSSTAGSIDPHTMALRLDIPSSELEVRLRARRRQTAMIARATFALACIFLVGWGWRAIVTPWTVSRVTSALYFLPFCLMFFLVAFYNALLNFQIRIGRLATWREYLLTEERFLPF